MTTPQPRPPGHRRPARLVGGLLLTAALLVPSSLPAHAVPARAPVLDRASADRFVRDHLERTGVPGATVTVTRGDRVVLAAGYGHTAAGEEMTARTPVPVASLSKAMTALAVTGLAEEGRVDLDRPVHDQLPEFAPADARAERITPRQLLHQTSGMADSAHPDLVLPQPHTLKEAVVALRGTRLAADPGTTWSYHNTNYAVAARLVEAATGTPYAAHLRERLFAPLGMSRTETADTTADMPDAARGHVRAYGRTWERAHPRLFTAGAFGVVSTAEDLGKWLIAQHTDGISPTGRRVAPAEAVRLTRTPPPGQTYGMGWNRRAESGQPLRIEHTGSLFTHNSMATLLPESGVGIAVVTNTGMVSGDDAPLLVDGLVDLAEGRAPAERAPFTDTADPVLAVLTLSALALAVRAVARAGRWARRAGRGPLRLGLRLVPYLLPVLLFFHLNDVLGLLMRRAGTLEQITYVWPALFVWSAGTALAAAAVLVARGAALLRKHRSRSGPVAAEQAAPVGPPAVPHA
ncbi:MULTISPECIES: serine hydrolase domain-containing protein [Streptomyces]|uniref:Serine hydrolase n=2 Tax=Streptomyces diastaticus group TaxID=2849069 RepID=A0A8H9HEJ1_9ACTN|nr:MULTISPECIES: serine hydrolase domain-containing protein [Streptomyces]NEE28331.1 beta-lactamase family protein [Streptomyces sp. SID7982]PJM84213.1 serine hydrolase [Streptomyces sp. TSRI0384-2]QNE84306.1 serine hydrolase [Streptomyces rutgersensis]RPK88164.1 D-alanyl-D-alanine carboxypeptidase precursor [Streptomyces sp. ADI98-12]WPR54297.1 serine hydrolase domain-containing protein [Streptomyces sp. S399]